MALYSVDKLIPEARRLAAEYRRATGQSLGISPEIARHDAASALGLELVQPGAHAYDAIGREHWPGLKLIIKGRAIFEEGKSGQRLGQIKADQDWDGVVLVVMDDNYEAVEMYLAQRDDLITHLQDAHSRRARRGSISVAKFKIIAELVWTRENGLEDGTWSNR